MIHTDCIILSRYQSLNIKCHEPKHPSCPLTFHEQGFSVQEGSTTTEMEHESITLLLLGNTLSPGVKDKHVLFKSMTCPNDLLWATSGGKKRAPPSNTESPLLYLLMALADWKAERSTSDIFMYRYTTTSSHIKARLSTLNKKMKRYHGRH